MMNRNKDVNENPGMRLWAAKHHNIAVCYAQMNDHLCAFTRSHKDAEPKENLAKKVMI